MPRRRQLTTDAAATTDDTSVPRSRSCRGLRQPHAHHRHPAGVGMKRWLDPRLPPGGPVVIARQHPNPARRSSGTRRQARAATNIPGSHVATDLQGRAIDQAAAEHYRHDDHRQRLRSCAGRPLAVAQRCSHHQHPGTTTSQLPPPALAGQARHQRQPPPAWLEQLPAGDAQDGVEVACQGDEPDRHQGPSPFRFATPLPAADLHLLRPQRRSNVDLIALDNPPSARITATIALGRRRPRWRRHPTTTSSSHKPWANTPFLARRG